MDTKNARKPLGSFRISLLCLALAGAFPILAEAAVAGRVQFVAGDVRIVGIDGKERAARKGEDVSEGETVLTGTGASAQLKMIDGGVLALRPGTRLKVDSYVFNGAEDGTENAALSLVKGGLRAITGLIGNTNKEKYKFQTPNAVIGIRGTDHEPVVLAEPAPGVAAENPPGTYDKVNVGATSLTTNAGTTVIGRNQVGFAASLDQLPVLLPKLPNFYKATPAPLAKTEQKKEQKEAAASQSAESGEAKAEAKVEAVQAIAAGAGLTGTDANGNRLNLTQQTLTTAGGQLLSLTGENVSRPRIGTELVVGYPYKETGGSGIFPGFFSFGGSELVLTRDGAGNLTAAVQGNDGFGFRGSLSQSGGLLTDLGGNAASGLAWGRWQGGEISLSMQYFGIDSHGQWGLGAQNAAGEFVIGAGQAEVRSLGAGSLHWLTGSAAEPGHLAQVLTGSANYSLVGGTRPTDQFGNVGTLNSAGLSVNFSTQIVDAKVNFSLGGNTWAMQSSGMTLNGTRFSSAFSCNAICGSGVSLTKNGVATGGLPTPNSSFSLGFMNGMLMGPGLSSAGLQYSVQEMVPTTSLQPGTGQPVTTFAANLMQGVAGFSGPTQNVHTPFRVVGITDGWSIASFLVPSAGGTSINPGGVYRGSVEGSAQPVARVVDGPAGMTEFIGRARGYTPVNQSQSVPGLFQPAPENTIRIGSAANTDLGSLTIGAATVSWGRWEGGNVDIYSRDGTVKLGVIDNSGRSMHWLNTSALSTTSVSLPVTGTATYTLAGNTKPTDLNGNTGTLGTATLNADFTKGKIDAGISVSFNSPTNTSNWSMSANNVPLDGSGGFKSSSMMNGVGGITHTVTCSGASCGTVNSGYIDGHFIAGGQGAAMRYGMAGQAIGVTGVVVMKR